MQIKVIIGTIAFMLTMMVFGYAALREPERLEHFTGAREGRQIETGAKLYFDNCATCHGVEARAEECSDAAGESIACVGRPLNNYFLLCGDRPQRLVETSYEGTKRQFIEGTLASGRVGSQMVPWLNTYGGPFRGDQLVDVAAYVLNFENEALCAAPPVEFPWPEPANLEELFSLEVSDPVEFVAAPGDPARGEELFASYGCNACHGNLADSASAAVGPWLGNIGVDGATRVPGYDAQQYVYESILNVNAFIAPDCPTGPCVMPSSMRADFGSAMATTPQDMIDLLSYLVGE